MRTKTLLLTAALSAAGIATSMAQVYSVNAVGYVNTPIAPGYNLVSNPLVGQNNTVASLFADAGAQADGLQVFKYTSTGYKIAQYDFGEWTGEGATETVVPGEGVFVRNPLSTPLTVTFVGEVMQSSGATPLRNTVPSGLSIKSSQVPVAGAAALEGLPGGEGDQLFRFNPTTGYTIYAFDFGEWAPALPTDIKVGEAFFYRNAGATKDWTRTFNVNQ